MSTHTYTGACLCNTVRYEIPGPLSEVAHCHCSRCRKHHGSLFATWTMGPLEGFRYLSGEDAVGTYASALYTRAFCRHCGAKGPSALPEHGVVTAPAGNLAGLGDARPIFHIFAASKVPWYEITDGLPQYPGYPPDIPLDGLPDPAPEAPAEGRTGGSCLCGAVAFEFDGVPLRMQHCHCSRCRRGRSAAHATNAFVPLDRFRFTRGETLVRDYPLPGAKYFGVAFCTACGSDVPRLSLERGLAVIPAGSLDTDPGIRPSRHIYVGSKADWFEITDGLPQFVEMPG